MVVLGKVIFNQLMEIGNINLPGGKGGFGGEVITLTSVISLTVNGSIYLDGGAGQGDLQPMDGNR